MCILSFVRHFIVSHFVFFEKKKRFFLFAARREFAIN